MPLPFSYGVLELRPERNCEMRNDFNFLTFISETYLLYLKYHWASKIVIPLSPLHSLILSNGTSPYFQQLISQKDNKTFRDRILQTHRTHSTL